ncbi:mediator of RNA polymerase II transcription subunit 27-B-like [Gigantopelta aegis]|uniref:mediator of RNA polymerase II transcription subunit 27-B-like n=1 Tax=Gigantopelta aegis TaxID=1735272 RepID=UPI001B888B00|nr:mediator of RNA polymerase II transcription subunit 27-B-like [Gigantopelta aegis]
MAREQTENLNLAIRLTQKLRSSVSQVFQDLADGFENQNAFGPQESEPGTGVSASCSLNNLQKSLKLVNNNYSELDKVASTLSTSVYTANTGHICVDPVVDKMPVYSQILHSYKWTNKMHEHSEKAVSILQQNSLKRSSLSPYRMSRVKGRSVLLPSAYPPSKVDTFIAQLDRQFQDIQFNVTRPLGSCAVVQVTLGRTMKVLLVFRGLMIEWVKVKGYQEDFLTEDGKIDIWSNSRFQVFRKITDHATAATLHFYHIMPEISIQSFIIWLQGYKNLFSAPCHKCGKHLQGALLPTWRDLRTRDPYHESCRH